MIRRLAYDQKLPLVKCSNGGTISDVYRLIGFTGVDAHARALRTHTALLWQCAEDVFECAFTDPNEGFNFFFVNSRKPGFSYFLFLLS